jgi:hypothetical protein
MVEASTRADTDGRALAISEMAGIAEPSGTLEHPEETGVNTLANATETTRTTALGATREWHDLLRRVMGEYREMPGLSLTVSQAARFWGLDTGTCAVVLTTLLERQVLRRTAIGTYLRGPRG